MDRTLFDKLWDDHVVLSSNDGLDLLHIDRSLLTDLTGTLALEELEEEGRAIHSPHDRRIKERFRNQFVLGRPA